MAADMDDGVRKDLLSVITKALEHLKLAQYSDLKELSNHTIHNASIFQDEDSRSLAVVIYALSKIAERGHKPDHAFMGLLQDAEHDLEGHMTDGYRQRVRAIFRKISEVDSKLKLYIDEVVRMGQVRKGSKIYDHGISLAQAAELLGISQWELANYTGHTESQEHSTVTMTESRLALTRKLFGIR